ncbi:unnamed protein product [Prunus armeniaca]
MKNPLGSPSSFVLEFGSPSLSLLEVELIDLDGSASNGCCAIMWGAEGTMVFYGQMIVER